MPFPQSMIKNWVQHSVPENTCTRCGLTGVPRAAVHLGGVVYEKEGRFHLDVPQKFEVCVDGR